MVDPSRSSAKPDDADTRPLDAVKVLLTGASGFVGRHILRHLLDSGTDVLTMSRSEGELSPGVEHVQVRHWSEDALRTALRDRRWNAVINAAAYGVRPHDRTAEDAALVNATGAGTIALLARERDAQAFVQVGTCSEYDAVNATGSPLEVDRTPPETMRLYGATKAAGMALTRSICASGDVAFRGLRLFNVYGPGEPAHRLLPSLIRHLTSDAGGAVPLSAGTQLRDFVHVDDTARAVVAALVHAADTGGDRLANVASGQGTSVREFAQTAALAIGAPDDRLEFGAIPMRPDDVAVMVGSTSGSEKAFGPIELRPPSQGVIDAVVEMTNSAAKEDR